MAQFRSIADTHISAAPYTPGLSPIEMLWDEIREKGMRNEGLASLGKAVDHICDCIRSLMCNAARMASNTYRSWFAEASMC